jgi:hypothetical protein
MREKVAEYLQARCGGNSMNARLIDQTLNALERLMAMFAIERVLYLACSVVSFGLLILASVILVRAENLDWTSASLLFGSTGLITLSAFRVSFFLNQAFDLIKAIILNLPDTSRERPK